MFGINIGLYMNMEISKTIKVIICQVGPKNDKN